jgi:hypothetical protein
MGFNLSAIPLLLLSIQEPGWVGVWEWCGDERLNLIKGECALSRAHQACLIAPHVVVVAAAITAAAAFLLAPREHGSVVSKF